jgi:hypothetical protein
LMCNSLSCTYCVPGWGSSTSKSGCLRERASSKHQQRLSECRHCVWCAMYCILPCASAMTRLRRALSVGMRDAWCALSCMCHRRKSECRHMQLQYRTARMHMTAISYSSC